MKGLFTKVEETWPPASPGIETRSQGEDRRPPARPSFVLERADLQDWLLRRASLPLRFVSAPTGFGKSLLLQRYAARRKASYRHSSELIPSGEMLPPIEGKTRAEIIIDDVDALPTHAIAALFASIRSTSNAAFILGTRTRDIIDDHRCLVDGTGDLLDAGALAFTWSEIAELCSHYRIEASEADVRGFVEESDGWPMLVHAAIKHAALERRPLKDLFGAWIAERGAMLREAIETTAPDDVIEMLSRADTTSIAQMRRLERSGLFVIRKGNDYNVLRAVAALFPPEPAQSPGAIANPMSIQLLGEFQLTIGDVRVEWLRRKDAQVVKYLAMSPNGSATREELCRAFWPRNERPHALQNLRTTCSNIRAALRASVPDCHIEQYFDSRGDSLRLIFDAAHTDLAQFNTLAAAANDALDHSELDIALTTLDQAHRMYRGSLIVEPHEAFYAPIARELEERFSRLQELRLSLRTRTA